MFMKMLIVTLFTIKQLGTKYGHNRLLQGIDVRKIVMIYH